MPIRIRQIEAEGLGPLSTFSQDFRALNLIYSPNEGGKTFLTAFLVSALFRQYGQNQPVGRGKVHLEGPSLDKGPYSPNSRHSLADHLETYEGISPDLARLLVVKGGEPTIPGAGKAIDKAGLRTFLSDQRLLDQVVAPIQKTIQTATIEDGTLVINKQGKGKDLKALEERLAELEAQVREVDENHATGELEALNRQLAANREALEAQNHAKRYLAYQLNAERQAYQETLTQQDPSVLTRIEEDIRNYEKAVQQYDEAAEALETAKQHTAHHQWVQQVREHYQGLRARQTGIPGQGWLWAAGLAWLAAIFSTWLQNTTAALVSLVLGAALIGVYLYRLRHASPADSQELANLRQRFQAVTQRPLGSLADIDAELEAYRSAYDEQQRLQQVMADQKATCQQLANRIQQAFYRLKAVEPSHEEWQDQLKALWDERQAAQKQYEELENRLAALGVPASDYTEIPADEPFNAERLRQLQAEYQSLSERITEAEEALAHLKSEIGALTGQNLANSPFHEAYEALLKERREVHTALTDLKSEVVAGKYLTDLVEALKQTDDRVINDALNADYLRTPLRTLTGRYQGLTLNKNGYLVVQDRVADYPVAELSTGAYEQVMLALRAGISAYLLQTERLFLWLDDALQHTDWQRRPEAIQYLAELARDGWQVTYLTMDDHIRDTFDEVGARHLHENYQRIDLEQKNGNG